MNITAQQIFEDSTPEDGLISLMGDGQVIIQHIAAYEFGKEGDLVFIPNKSALKTVLKNKVSLAIIPQKLAQFIPTQPTKTSFITTHNIGVAHARLKQRYADHDFRESGWEKIHASAIIHPSVSIPSTTTIGPNVVIEKGAIIGNRCTVMAKRPLIP